MLSGPLLSAVWLALCGAYIHTQVGWDVLPTMLPSEIAVIVLGVTLPLAFLWVVTSFRQRAAELSATTTRLSERVGALVFPSEQAESRARGAAQSLQREAEALADTMTAAAAKLEQTAAGLGTRLAETVAGANAASERAERVRGGLEAAAGTIERLAVAIATHAGTIEKTAGRDLAAASAGSPARWRWWRRWWNAPSPRAAIASPTAPASSKRPSSRPSTPRPSAPRSSSGASAKS